MFSRLKESVINSINPPAIIDPSVSIPSSLPRSRSSPASPFNSDQTSVSKNNQTSVSKNIQTTVPRVYTYTRPGFLHLRTEDEIQVTADHSIRPIIVPRVKDSSLPYNTGYAECINGGKSARNEDQAAVYSNSLTVNEQEFRDTESKMRRFITSDHFLPSIGTRNIPDHFLPSIGTRNGRQNPLSGRSQSMNFNGSSDGVKENGLVHGDDQDGVRKRTATGIEGEGGDLKGEVKEGEKGEVKEGEKGEVIPWTYFALFDGHAGPAIAVASSATLHSIIQSKLESISHLLLHLHDQESESASLHDQESESASLHDQESESASFHDQESGSVPSRAESDSINGFDSMTINSDQVNSSNHNQTSPVNPSRLTQTSTVNPSRLTQTSPVNPNRLTQTSPVPSLTVESLIIGALESSFWEMDQLIERDKRAHQSPVCSGGCTVLVSLFILGRVFVANAGDSRAVLLTRNFSRRGKEGTGEEKEEKEEEKREEEKKKDEREKREEETSVRPVSFDFTPESERERIKMTALVNPSLIGRHFSPVEFLRRPTRQDLGQPLLVRDVFMSKGWTLKTVTHEDLGKIPLISGSGKRSRLLGTIGVTRGFGDHELKACNFSSSGAVFIKPFLSPQPEVQIIDLRARSPSNGDREMERILIMGTDGLWDVTTNERAGSIVSSALDSYNSSSLSTGTKSGLQGIDILNRYRYISAAQDLVMAARGKMRTAQDLVMAARGKMRTDDASDRMTGSASERMTGSASDRMMTGSRTRLSGSGWRTSEGKAATVDDISVFVIPLEDFARESRDWIQGRRKRWRENCGTNDPKVT